MHARRTLLQSIAHAVGDRKVVVAHVLVIENDKVTRHARDGKGILDRELVKDARRIPTNLLLELLDRLVVVNTIQGAGVSTERERERERERESERERATARAHWNEHTT